MSLFQNSLNPYFHNILLITEDGTWPDVDQIWTEYKEEATCILGDTGICAQYTYYFDGFGWFTF